MEQGEEEAQRWNHGNQTPLLENQLDFAMDAIRQHFRDAKERHQRNI